MPLYEFNCDGCRQDFELLVRSTNWHGAACPHCGSKKLTKKLSVFAQTTGTNTPAAAACTTKPATCSRCGPHHRH